MSNPVCPQTGAPMYRDARPMTLTYKDQSITIDMPGCFWDSSDESIHTGQDAAVSDCALNHLKARTEGLLEPEDIRRIRKKLAISQEEAGRVGGPRAFQKYESGDLMPSRAISSALRLLDRDPGALGVLKVQQHNEHVA
jgi:HTH-type transcriptional regulator / antitoxin MqsA